MNICFEMGVILQTLFIMLNDEKAFFLDAFLCTLSSTNKFVKYLEWTFL